MADRRPSLSVYRGPDTLGGALYEGAANILTAIPNWLLDDSEREQVQRTRAVEDALRSVGEFVVGPEEVERMGRRVVSGEGTAGDYAALGLMALPFAPTPIRRVLAKPFKAAGRQAASVGKKAANTRVGRYLLDPNSVLEIDDAVEASFQVIPTRRAATPRLAARPAPAALPAPGPGLPPLAAKPRGGQWVPDVELRGVQRPAEPDSVEALLNELTDNASPEAAARLTASVSPAISSNYRPWLEKALAKYYKRDFGSPDDPILGLAERGLHYEAGMTPEKWSRITKDYLMEDPIGMYTVPGTSGYDAGAAAEMLEAAPWLAKQPATDPIYGISSGGLDLSDFNRTMQDAIRLYPEDGDIPLDLVVRPEALERMSFPQAVERVGRINQWRDAQAEAEALSAMSSPAVRTFKEYAEDNPKGLRWVEIGKPQEAPDVSDYSIRWSPDDEAYEIVDPQGRFVGFEPTRDMAEDRAMQAADYDTLEAALGFEGETMGHCVGDYCDEVLEQGARIFSLRDAKGMPHVTIETRPGTPVSSVPPKVREELGQQARAILDEQVARMPNPPTPGDLRWSQAYQTNLGLLEKDWLAAQPNPDKIIQIKGKGNRAPVDEYLPFVQDFVKSQPWSGVGDLSNTRLVKLPDGRYITEQQAEEGIAAIPELIGNAVYDPHYLHSMNPQYWDEVSQYFEGFAIGGRVEADRCFANSNRMRVKGKK